jgi:vacuolar-type H+-ATPase subunit E/Vma4
MSAEKIIEQIKIDSDNEIKLIKQEAENQVKILLENEKKEAKIEAEKIIKNGEKKSENLKKILISKTNQDVKREIISAREKIIDECFSKALHKLSTLKEKNYERLVRKLIRDGQKKLGKNCTILATRDIDKKIARDLGIDITGTIESSGGILLKSADGKAILDHTFDGILKREKYQIRTKVGKLLFS